MGGGAGCEASVADLECHGARGTWPRGREPRALTARRSASRAVPVRRACLGSSVAVSARITPAAPARPSPLLPGLTGRRPLPRRPQGPRPQEVVAGDAASCQALSLPPSRPQVGHLVPSQDPGREARPCLGPEQPGAAPPHGPGCLRDGRLSGTFRFKWGSRQAVCGLVARVVYKVTHPKIRS